MSVHCMQGGAALGAAAGGSRGRSSSTRSPPQPAGSAPDYISDRLRLLTPNHQYEGVGSQLACPSCVGLLRSSVPAQRGMRGIAVMRVHVGAW